MQYTLLGKTGRKVSRIGFGGATAGLTNYLQPFDPVNDRDRQGVVEAIREAYRLGINYFDTAEGYGSGASEEIYAEGLRGIPREEIFLATKTGHSKNEDGQRCIRKEADILGSIERSLRRLERDNIDLIQIHGSYYSEETARLILEKGGVADILEKAKAMGLVKYTGFSIETQNTALDMLVSSRRFDIMQVQYNLMFQHPYEAGFKTGSIYQAREAGLGIIVMRTLTSGLFQKWIRAVNPENTFNYNPALLQYVLSNPLVDTALVGMRGAAEVRENAGVCDDLSGRLDLDALHKRYV